MSGSGPYPAHCPHCQAAIDQEDATSCWLCEQELDRCPRCWAKTGWPDATSCGQCGTELARPAAPVDRPLPPLPQPAAPVEAPLSKPAKPVPFDEIAHPPVRAGRPTFGLGTLMLVI